MAAMKRMLPYLVVLGPPVGLTLVYMAMLVLWHRRLSSGTADETTRARIIRRSKLFASVIRNLGWAYLVVVIILGVIGRVFHLE